MESEVQDKFEKMGARARLTVVPDWALRSRRAWRWVDEDADRPVSIDVRQDRAGEYFDIRHRQNVAVRVLDVRKDDRHLLLMVAQRSADGREVKSRFLCGRDERSWFVAAIPESAGVGSVQAAKDALKPPLVWASIREHGLSVKQRDQRRNEAFIRQGEWFFIPRPRLNVSDRLVLRNEPIRRGAGKPHMCQFLYRVGGEQVYVCSKHANGLTKREYSALPEKERQRHSWRVMVRDAAVYAKGHIRHPDHKTVWLQCWHQVVMNTETQAAAMRHVAFLD